MTLPPCSILSFTGFQIFVPGGGLKAVPNFQVAGSKAPVLTALAGAVASERLSAPAGAASGKLQGREIFRRLILLVGRLICRSRRLTLRLVLRLHQSADNTDDDGHHDRRRALRNLHGSSVRVAGSIPP